MSNQKQTNESREERTEKILRNPETMDTIFNHIVHCGSEEDLCKMWGVRLCDIMRWVFGDEKRKAIYNDACRVRREGVLRPILRFVGVFNNYETWEQKCREFHDNYLYGDHSNQELTQHHGEKETG